MFRVLRRPAVPLVLFKCCLCSWRLVIGKTIVRHVFHLSEFFADPDGIEVLVAGINQEVNAPTIEVHRGDQLQIEVQNGLHVPISFHMHGLEYRSEPFMDGVAGLTQCAIAPNHTFLYDFSVQDYPGTYWYHPHTDLSHLSSIDSMKGVLIVHPPLGSNELHHDLYDEEMVLFYTDWWHQSQHELYMGRLGGQLGPVTTDADGIRVGTFPYQGMLLNGRGGASVAPLAMQPGSRYRLRVINGGWVFPIEFSVDGHALLVIQTDGADTEPLEVDSIQISNGERYDVILVRRSEACASRTSFWVRAAALGAMPRGGLSTALHLGEAGPPEECPHQNPKTLNCVWDRSRPRSGCLLLTALRRHARAGETYGWDHGAAGEGDIVMHTIDARFTSPPNFGHFVKLDGADRTGDAWTADEFFSGQWVQGALPNLPPMIHGEDHLTPATVTLTAVSGTIVELLLRNVDKYAHPWHMHGHKFVVMEQAAVDFASCSIMYCFEGIPGNSRSSAAHAQTAVLKDTVTIPAGGWLRLRFQADNPGWWIFHCHIHMHLSDGMGLVIYEPGPVGYEFPEPPSDLLTCAPSPEPTTCTCFEDSDAVMGTSPLSSYTCSRKWLCAGDSSLFLGLPSTTQSRSRDLAAGRAWRYSVAVVWLLLLLFGGIILNKRRIWDKLFFKGGAKLAKHKRASFYEDEHGEAIQAIVDVETTPAVSWRDLSVTTKLGEKLLCDCHGELRPGQLMGLIGRSGSGKTTLLDVLANRGLRGGARASGTLLIKGNVAASVDPARISEAVRYCQQVELLPENLTVMEFLAFHVAIRSLNLDPAAARLQARAHAPNFGLGNLVDKPISMLSGGQKKRVAVAMEMIKPSLLCIFDEPFSGLDSNTTFQLFRNVKASLRKNGSASIMTLHTVTPQVFDELDLVMMLHGGRQVFFGSPEQAAGYCASELGRPIPPGWTASDHFLKAVYDLEEANPGHAAECSATWKDRLDRTAAASADAEALPCQKVSARTQFQLLLRRELMQELPVVLSLHQLAQYAAISLIVGWLYFGVASGTKQRDLRESVSLCFYTTTLWTFTPLYGAIMRTRLRLHRVDAELKKGILTVGPFAAATSVVDVVLHSIWPTLYGVVVFAMTDSGQDPVSFFNMVVLVVLCAVTYQSLGVLISVLLPDVDAAMALATAFAQTTLVAGGFYRTMPHSIAWYGSVSVTTYAFRGLLRASLSWMNTYECHPNVMGDTRAGQSSCFIEMSGIIDDLRLRGIEVATSPVDATPLLEQTVLVLFLVFSRILAYFVLRWRLRRSYTNWS